MNVYERIGYGIMESIAQAIDQKDISVQDGFVIGYKEKCIVKRGDNIYLIAKADLS